MLSQFISLLLITTIMCFNVKDDQCKTCLMLLSRNVVYDVITAELLLNCPDQCCPKCFECIEVLQFQGYIEASNCSQLQINVISLSLTEVVGEIEHFTQSVNYRVPLTGGCYTVSACNAQSKYFLSFQWHHPNENKHHQEYWKTTFYLNTRPNSKEIEVIWTEDKFPNNFSSYNLQLWSGQDQNLSCTGLYNNPKLVTQDANFHTALVSEPHRLFSNLTPAWYCARVTPVDSRCDSLRCIVRASQTVQLLSPFSQIGVTEAADEGRFGYKILLLTLGLALLAITLGLSSAFVYRKSLFVKIERKLPDEPLKKTVCTGKPKGVVLVVWTELHDYCGVHKRAVQLFKEFLSERFQVWDYLDMLSLPVSERELLLQSAAGWLSNTLANKKIKVVLVSSVGAVCWQQAVRGERPAPVSSTPLDNLLFPLLLQQIQHSVTLLTAYSRIFLVRFSCDLRAADRVLDGIVPGMLYLLPEHLHILMLSLLGLTAEESSERQILLSTTKIFEEKLKHIFRTECKDSLKAAK